MEEGFCFFTEFFKSFFQKAERNKRGADNFFAKSCHQKQKFESQRACCPEIYAGGDRGDHNGRDALLAVSYGKAHKEKPEPAYSPIDKIEKIRNEPPLEIGADNTEKVIQKSGRDAENCGGRNFDKLMGYGNFHVIRTAVKAGLRSWERYLRIRSCLRFPQP